MKISFTMKATLLTVLLLTPLSVRAGEKPGPLPSSTVPHSWHERAVSSARILSQVQWSPAAETLPKEYTGVLNFRA